MSHVLWIIVAIVLLPGFAFSLPKYSLKEKQRCYECHYNRKGGGPLNQKGKFYGQRKNLEGYAIQVSRLAKKKEAPAEVSKPARVAKESPKKEVPPVRKEEAIPPTPEPRIVVVRQEPSLLDKTSLSGDMILSFLANEDSQGAQDFYLMKAEPVVTTQVADDLHTVFGYNFAAPSLTAYGQYQVGSYYFQAGSFKIPFGIDTLEHNNLVSTLIKEHYDLTLDTRDIGLEIGYEEDFFMRGAILNGGREPRERPTLLPTFERNIGGVINTGYKGMAYSIPFLLGASVLMERRVPPGKVVRGRPPKPVNREDEATGILNLYGELGSGDFSLLGEFAYGRHMPFSGDDSFGFYLRPSYNLYDYWSMAVRAETFSRDRLFLKDSWLRLVFSSEYQFSKYASIEPMLRLNKESGTVPTVADDEFFVLLHVKF